MPSPTTPPDDRPDAPGSDHYFTAAPASDGQRRPLAVTLAGRQVTVQTAPGIFSPGRIDLGTQVLLDHLPPPPARGELLDLGCGWGPVALTLALRSPDARVWAVDVNARALDLVRRNAEALGLRNVVVSTPDDVPDDVHLDAVVSNPPIRVGKPVLHAMLEQWLGRVAPGGRSHLVVQRNLGADSLHRWLAEDQGLRVERVASAKGFRVLRVS